MTRKCVKVGVKSQRAHETCRRLRSTGLSALHFCSCCLGGRSRVRFNAIRPVRLLAAFRQHSYYSLSQIRQRRVQRAAVFKINVCLNNCVGYCVWHILNFSKALWFSDSWFMIRHETLALYKSPTYLLTYLLKRYITLLNKSSHSLPYGITQCYLPSVISELPRLTPARQAGRPTRFTYPEGMEGWVGFTLTFRGHPVITSDASFCFWTYRVSSDKIILLNYKNSIIHFGSTSRKNVVPSVTVMHWNMTFHYIWSRFGPKNNCCLRKKKYLFFIFDCCLLPEKFSDCPKILLFSTQGNSNPVSPLPGSYTAVACCFAVNGKYVSVPEVSKPWGNDAFCVIGNVGGSWKMLSRSAFWDP